VNSCLLMLTMLISGCGSALNSYSNCDNSPGADCDPFDTATYDTDKDSGDPLPPDADGDGYTTDQGDCNDENASIHPGATDTYGDTVDQNCDGTDGVDSDSDGVPSVASGGDDCDDTNPEIFPGAKDILGDGVDQNCDSIDGEGLCDDTCSDANNGQCDDGGETSVYRINCVFGTDCTDCGIRLSCLDTCQYANDGWCDDGGEGSSFYLCDMGTDCSDCGPRP